MPKMPMFLPIHTQDADAAWGGSTKITNIVFKNFNGSNWCGSKNTIFNINPEGPDYTPSAVFDGVTFDNVL
jgi:hypothetical protein